jgi:hypothetical protein
MIVAKLKYAILASRAVKDAWLWEDLEYLAGKFIQEYILAGEYTLQELKLNPEGQMDYLPLGSSNMLMGAFLEDGKLTVNFLLHEEAEGD